MEAYGLEPEISCPHAYEKFCDLISTLESEESAGMNLSSLENLINKEGREVLRLLLEEHIRDRGTGNIGSVVKGSDKVTRSHRRIRKKAIKTIFGKIEIERTVYSLPGHTGLIPKDAMLNLEKDCCCSHNLQYRAAIEVAKGSFEEAQAAISRQTNVNIPKRQIENIAKSVATDFDDFYGERPLEDIRKITNNCDILIMTTDAKGIAMKKSDLRPATQKRASDEKKLKKRLSKGEKHNSKRMAQVGSVYSINKQERTPSDIINGYNKRNSPRPKGKRVWASIEKPTAHIIAEMFNEADRRDPSRKKKRAILVDGNIHQIATIEAEITQRKLHGSTTLIVDIIHVLEYIWKAAWAFFDDGDPKCEEWVTKYFEMVLNGKAKQVAAAIRRSATLKGLKQRKAVDQCSNYLHNNSSYLRYDQYLASGLPIATGVIEGACRHLVKDRMNVTGARWSLKGAEAVLKLRSIHTSGDWREYQSFHEKASYNRNHKNHYALPQRLEKTRFSLVE